MQFAKPSGLLCCALLALASSTLFAGNAASSPESALRAGTVAWMEAYNAGDVERIVAMYSDDAIVMPPDAPPATGVTALRTFLTGNIAGMKAAGLRLRDGSSDVGTSGDLGWHAGTFAVVDAAGKTVGAGKYMEIWQRRNGKWVIIRDIWNNDAPAAPAGS
ncbi:MAG: DUF4440 domain-containing protein [Lysobacter sp.]|nr:DUF4440 domain-containing protein [Lysobacter sp.]